jgi:iron complex outermembrane receptor protein
MRIKFPKAGRASGAACILFSIGSPSLFAQDTEKSLSPSSISGDVDTEIIEVRGVRSSLETALNTKREAPSVVDIISASDIDSLPALDLGEALQAIPGIQLNTDDGQRNSEINLRGLSGGFVKTTAEGQSFATPSRSEGEVGGSNPFGSFEASVFDGVTVIKSPTADMQEGGIAGTVDQKLQQALSKTSDKYSVNLGGRYEELTDKWNQQFRFSGVKHLIEDKLGIAFKVAGSEQIYRRDTANYTQYSTLNETVTPSLAEYKAIHGLDNNAVIRAITRAGQVSEIQNGDRISATANIEYRVTDDFKLGMHLLYTKRDLTESNFEDVSFSARNQVDVASQAITPLGAPIQLNSEEDGTPVYAGSHVLIENANWAPANRLMSFTETAKGAILYGDYLTDNWVLDGKVTYSESLNEFQNQGLDVRHTTRPGQYRDPETGVRTAWAPTGIDVEINTGNGDLSKAFTNASGFNNFDYSGLWSGVDLSGFSSRLDPNSIGFRDVTFFVNGRVDRPEREFNSAEFNAKRFLDLGNDISRLTSLKFGAYHSQEKLVNTDLRVGAGGINTRALTEENIFNDVLFVDTQNPYFNGDFPGYFGSGEGWRSINSRGLKTLLQDGLENIEGGVIADPTGFYVRTQNGVNQFFADNFSVEQRVQAAYVMSEFDGELGDYSYSGNIGIRYVETNNDIVGSGLENEVPVVVQRDTDYSHTLPSFNIAFELHEDVILRGAFYEGIVRPNLRSQTPSSSLTDTPSRVQLELPSSDVKPYTSDNYDLSLEWYNRDGSAISIGVFKKEITGLFQRETICPVGQELLFGNAFGALESISVAGQSLPLCQEIAPFVTESGEVLENRTVTVNRSFNSDEAISVNGYELAVQQKLDFLPYPWSGFGGVFNYTYVNTDQGENTRMTGIAPRSYNLIGYWEDSDVSIRLAYNWQASKLLDVGGNTSFLGSDAREQTSGGRLDLSTSYKFYEGARLNFRGFNLNNRQEYEFIGGNEDAISRVRYAGRIYEVSITYSF